MKDERHEKGTQPPVGFHGHHTVVGVFSSVQPAEHALAALHYAGFPHSDLSLIIKGTEAAEEIPSQAEADHASRGAGAGAAIGGILGGIAGAAALAIPGVGPAIAIGWLGMTIGGVAVGAAAGGWLGSMAELGVPKDVAQRYANQLAQGEVLVLARAQSGTREAQARYLLEGAGSDDVESYPYQVRPGHFPGDATHIAEAHIHTPHSGNIDQLRVGMEVIGSDGEVVGRVKAIHDTSFLVDRRFHHDIFVPFDVVHDVTLNEVALTIPAHEVSQHGKRTRPGIVAEGEDWEMPPLIPPLR